MRKSVVGILGTAKNTGKTTTTTSLLDNAVQKRFTIGLTSIGYDGEDLDNITELPKPRIRGVKGMLIATAERCLGAGSAQITPLVRTALKTPLGDIVIGRVVEEGLVVLAGPNKGRDLTILLDKIEQLECSLTIVDGALNRLVPLMETEALVLATGASRDTSTEFLAHEVRSIYEIFRLPVWEGIDAKPWADIKNALIFIGKNGVRNLPGGGSLIRDQDVEKILSQLNDQWHALYVPGIIHEGALSRLLELGSEHLSGRAIVVRNPANLLVGGNSVILCDLIDRMKGIGVQLMVLRTLPILAVTVNPFYPLFNRYGDHKYEMAWVNRDEISRSVKKAVPIPVFDTIRDGGTGIFQLICDFFSL
jgi:hypothetical protein